MGDGPGRIVYLFREGKRGVWAVLVLWEVLCSAGSFFLAKTRRRSLKNHEVIFGGSDIVPYRIGNPLVQRRSGYDHSSCPD